MKGFLQSDCYDVVVTDVDPILIETVPDFQVDSKYVKTTKGTCINPLVQ